MSDVRLKIPAAVVATGLASVLAVTGGIEPSEAGFKLRMLANGSAAAAMHNGQAKDANSPQLSQIVVAEAEPDAADAPATEPAAEPEAAPTDAGAETADAPADASQDSAAKPADIAAAPAVPAVANAKSKPEEKPLPESRPDYYTERAKKTVEQDAKEESKPHPLQLANPDQNVVVCEGGCAGNSSAQIVFMEPREARKPIAKGEMIPSSSEGPANASAETAITCEAGCYDNATRSYASIPGGGMAGASAAVADGGSWVTTVVPSAAADGAKPAKVAGTKAKPEGGSGDWMKRINKEMGKSAAAPAAALEVTAKPVVVAEAKPETPAAGADASDKLALVKPEAAPVAPETEKPMAAAAVQDTAAASGTMQPTAGELTPAPVAVNTEQPKVEPAAPAEVASVSASDPVVPAEVPAASAALPAAAEAAKPVVAEVVAEPVPAAAAPEQQAAATPQVSGAEPSKVEAAAPAATQPETKPVVVAEAPPAPVNEPADATGEAAAVEKVSEPAKPVQVAEAAKTEAPAENAAPPAVAGTRHDPVVNIETADSEMANAMAKARASLPEFWSKLDQPAAGETDFSLKVAISGRNDSEVEHFWLTNIEHKDGVIMGTISNEPSTVKTVRLGQRYTINPEKISDWMFKRNGKMVGNETMRPLLKRLPAEQASNYRQMYETP